MQIEATATTQKQLVMYYFSLAWPRPFAQRFALILVQRVSTSAKTNTPNIRIFVCYMYSFVCKQIFEYICVINQ